ncbi:hypothetical protein OC844_000602 [Tilletia horrida]|nr:hypothetical protein OC844_000602 [Tilletia horrida]
MRTSLSASSRSSTLTAAALLLTHALAAPAPAPAPIQLSARSVTSDYSKLDASYDYIVVGGGLAGLTVAARLSEDPNVTVAVIEAGESGIGSSRFTTPNANLYETSVGTQYDWQWQTSSQDGLNGRTTPWPRGKVLGGSSAINGLYMVRPSKIEADLWASYTGAQQRFSWDTGLLPAMKKSESFSPPTAAVLQTVPSTQFNADSHGTNGPIHATWPATSYPIVQAYLETLSNLGVPVNPDPDGGNSWGTFYATSSINPANWTRSFSRTGYLDPNSARQNLDVLTGNQVTKVLFDSNSTSGSSLRATGVQFGQYDGATLHTLKASREVILSGGAINSPQILQLSGIGYSTLLNKYKIPVLKNLPGVGFHLQDHLATAVSFSPSTDNLAPVGVTGNAKQDSYVNAAISYVNITMLFNGQANADNFLSQLRANISQFVDAYNAPDEVKAGYQQTLTAEIDNIFNSPLGLVELLFAMGFGGVAVQGALQHPLSRGSIQIVSANPFTPPKIDPGYLSVEADAILLRQGLKLARQVGTSAPLNNFFGSENAPGSDVQADGDWEDYIRQSSTTEYHPSCSCAQLPEVMGGVVDANLLVYGTSNLRVIDASIPPVSLSAHLMTATYGIGEIGAQIIKDARAAAENPGANSTNTTSAGKNGSSGSGGGGNGDSKTGGAAPRPLASVSTLVSLAVPMCVGAGLALVAGL